ncbi:MAG: helix-hairpin-helix domain-containing protein [Phycisphaerales bacterium]|nr:helix-hairpin-helix domain-containing protein [Phycisphaerales bacterium]
MRSPVRAASEPIAAGRASAAAAVLTLCAALVLLGSQSFGPMAMRDQPRIVSREAATLRINPNAATAAELQLLPGIGPARAAAIVAHRETAAPPAFSTLSDLDDVHGIGPGILREISAFVALPDSEPEPFP